ncbi:MAG: PadR family transcriptional regulator [Rectinemataceae bacterium]
MPVEDATVLFEKWKSQFRKGYLELCVLALINSRGRAYGLDMMERLSAAGVEMSEGTLYPLLMRMTREGSLVASWETPDIGHPRKYYCLSAQGVQSLVLMRAEFMKTMRAMESFVHGGTGS